MMNKLRGLAPILRKDPPSKLDDLIISKQDNFEFDEFVFLYIDPKYNCVRQHYSGRFIHRAYDSRTGLQKLYDMYNNGESIKTDIDDYNCAVYELETVIKFKKVSTAEKFQEEAAKYAISKTDPTR